MSNFDNGGFRSSNRRNEFDRRREEFDRQFQKAERTMGVVAVLIGIVYLVFAALLVWGAIELIQFIGRH